MKTFWKILPMALPLLVLVAVLSSCGKNNKITGNVFSATPKVDSKAISAQRANGAHSNDLDPKVFRQRCTNMQGIVDMTNGGLCVVKVTSVALNPTSIGVQPVLPDFHPGDLVITSNVGVDKTLASVELGGEFFMNFGDTSVGWKNGPLSILLTGNTAGTASVAVWTCLDLNLNSVGCNTNLFKHP